MLSSGYKLDNYGLQIRPTTSLLSKQFMNVVKFVCEDEVAWLDENNIFSLRASNKSMPKRRSLSIYKTEQIRELQLKRLNM